MPIDIPADPAPQGYVTNPYEKEQAWALDYLKREALSNDDWINIGVREGVKMEKKKPTTGDDFPIPLVRGKGIIQGVSVLQMLPIISQHGARHHWDPRNPDGAILERYSRRTQKSYSLQKGAFMIQPRDIVGTQIIEVAADGNTAISAQCTVPDDAKTPHAKGVTRATLIIGGWMLRANENGDTELIYINQVNPNGSLPSKIITKMVEEIPNCVVNVIAWTKKHGLIPYIIQPDASIASTIRFESYVHEESAKYTLALICKGEGDKFDIFIDDKIKYKGGYTVKLEGDAKDFVTVTEASDLLKVAIGLEADGKKLDIIAQAM